MASDEARKTPTEPTTLVTAFTTLGALRGRAHELHLLTGRMRGAATVADYDRFYTELCRKLEPIGEKLELFSLEERGFEQVSEDVWHRKSEVVAPRPEAAGIPDAKKAEIGAENADPSDSVIEAMRDHLQATGTDDEKV